MRFAMNQPRVASPMLAARCTWVVFAAQFTLPASAQNAFFTPGPSYPAVSATWITAADFDSNGSPDLAACLNSQGSIVIRRNTGTGELMPPVLFPVGPDPRQLVAADFDLDNKIDLACPSQTAGIIYVCRGNGDGTFASPSTYPAGDRPFWLSSADVNADGWPDLLVSSETLGSGYVSVLLNQVGVTFAPRVEYPCGTGSHPGSSDIGVADLDLDGDIDFVIGNSISGGLSVFINTGNGNFAPQVIVPTPAAPWSVECADMNADGAPDLVAALGVTGQLALYFNAGNGTFQAPIVYPGLQTFSPHAVHCFDVNQDGIRDVVVPNYATRVSIFLGVGGGALAPETSFPASTPYDMAVADLNLDGQLDLALVSPVANTLTPVFNGSSIVATFCAGDGSGAACPCGNASPVGSYVGCRGGSGIGGRLRSNGNASVGSDTLSLFSDGIGTSPAIFFQGSLQVANGAGAPFGNGKRCAGGSLVRLGIEHTHALLARYPGSNDPSISVLGGAQPGQSRFYQVAYRDTLSYCTGAGFNLTNGLVIHWKP